MTGPGHRVELVGISQRFGDFLALDGIDVTIAPGEFVALLGPSGCGKSTLLRIIAGFIRQTQGAVRIGNAVVDGQGPAQRGVGIVFQNYALFPHMTVAQNVAYGLAARRWPKDRQHARVEEMLDLVQMRRFAGRYPRQLSGGQQQRVALARCLATDPKVLLLDEPFGALDKNLRLDMQIEVRRLQKACGVTAVLVTHDQEEALSMADRVAVMAGGKLEQIAPPTTLYDRPATLFVSGFVGTANLIPGRFAAPFSLRLTDGRILAGACGTALDEGSGAVMAVRPERIGMAAQGAAGALTGTVSAAMPLGAQIVYEVTCPIAGAAPLPLKVVLPRAGDAAVAIGETVALTLPEPEACRLYPQPSP